MKSRPVGGSSRVMARKSLFPYGKRLSQGQFGNNAACPETRGTWRHSAAFGVIRPLFSLFRKSLFQNGDLRKREKNQGDWAFEFNLSLQDPKSMDSRLGDKFRTFIPGNSCKRSVAHRAAECRRVRGLGIMVAYSQVNRIKKALDSFQNRGLESFDYSP